MLKKVVASFATLLLAAGMSVVAIAAPASATAYPPTGSDANHEQNWQVLPGETCYKIEPINQVPYPLPSPGADRTFSKVIVKAGSGDDANYVISSGLAQGTLVQHNVKDSISHLILCTVPAPPPPFDWNWTYPAPTCDALTVTYPANIPDGQANDVNVRIKYGAGFGTEVTLNFHNNGGTWSGTQSFAYNTHPNWPANIGPYKVVWTQVGGSNYHWEGEVTCGSVPLDATASVTTTPASCSAAETNVAVTVANATYDVTYPTATTWKVTATATANHLFSNGTNTLVIEGTFAQQQTEGCGGTECLPKSAVTYTYLPATNNGVVTVVNPNPSKYTNNLCTGFWVTATSWHYTSSGLWPQVLYQNNPLPKITSVGTYPFAAEVLCGQGDIYASFTASPYVGPALFGPNNPFTEKFLHEMGFAGPQPTWMYQAFGCNDAPVTVPTAQAITECGIYGSVSVPADTAKIDYTLTGNGQTGVNTVTAVAISPAVLKNYPAGGWSFNLGTYSDCVRTVTVDYVPDCAVDSTANWTVTNPGTTSVTLTLPDGSTHVATPGTSSFVTAPTASLTVTWGGAGGVAPGSATATASDLPVNDPRCIVDADVQSIHDKCTYTADGKANLRTASITFDNTRSARPVLFEIVGYPEYTQTVPAGQTVTLNFTDLGPIGGKYVVKAAGETYTLTLPTCVEPVKPEPKTRNAVLLAFSCDTVLATITTTTYTTDWVFDTKLVKWIETAEVAGTPVVSNRPMTNAEIGTEVCKVVVTDPVASTCLNQTDDTEFTSWIRVALNDNVEYRIDGTLVTTEYTEVSAGSHTVTADGLNGYTLAGGNPALWTDTHHEWTFTAVDGAVDCIPTPPSIDLQSSFATGVCLADAPWIFFHVTMLDPDNQAYNHTASLILTDADDPTKTATIVLGTLIETSPGVWTLGGTPDDKVLWPGASVDPVTGEATGWPGWEQDGDGNWVETTGNAAWSRDIHTAVLSVNPSIIVDLEYPDATPDCLNGPPEPPTLATVTPEFSYTPLTCTAAGSYTLGELTPGTIQWTVNGQNIGVGTYPVTSAQTLTFVASPIDEADGLDPDWVQPEPIAFSQGSEPCNTVALAMTGAANSFGLIWVGLLLSLTGVGIFLLRRRTATEQ